MEHHMAGPMLGNLIILLLAEGVTLGCFVAMFWMLLRPGETNPNHPKYEILRDDP